MTKYKEPGERGGDTRVQVLIGFGFASSWLRKWHEFCKRITEQSNAKQCYTLMAVVPSYSSLQIC